MAIFRTSKLPRSYPIDEATPIPTLDNKENALCGDEDKPDCPNGLNQEEMANYSSLSTKMDNLLKSEPPCPGDGNEDKVVNGLDIKSWGFFNQLTNGGSSWSDFNIDGYTDSKDLKIILQHLGTTCVAQK
jgi:hypothetical protein